VKVIIIKLPGMLVAGAMVWVLGYLGLGVRGYGLECTV